MVEQVESDSDLAQANVNTHKKRCVNRLALVITVVQIIEMKIILLWCNKGKRVQSP